MTVGPIATPAVNFARHREPPFVFPCLDQKETKSYTRKHADDEGFAEGMRAHLATFRAYPAKQVMGLHTQPAG